MGGSLKSIARRAGVSISTVSRALAGKPGVSVAKRAQIQALADRYGVVPNPHASSLRTGRCQGLTLITDLRGTGISGLRSHALFGLARERFHEVRVQVRNDDEGLDECLRRAAAGHPLAVVVSAVRGAVAPETLARLRDQGSVVTGVDTVIPGCDAALIDRVPGMNQAARLLLLSGRRHVLFYSGVPLSHPDDRLRGILQAHASLDRKLSAADLVPVNGSTFRDGYEVTSELLKRRAVDALFCYNDEMAIGALKALQTAGVRVPDDVMVIGFDNLPIAEYLPVGLTTVAQPVEDIAAAAVELCEQRLATPDAAPRQQVFPTCLVIRQTAPITSHEQRNQVFAMPPTGGVAAE
ncbi:MAG: hypothetical protein A3K19_22360 [Lentisphaerae bacterium RIFOXYB12_FULL_65_16]|nr:MAG: hypothetical protein A3K18_31475 [Lentisphaerae bacterium RIFOXYA12_64_32]OGV91955.1 MAG: hypothetical protein A3K19_22360 [Lentisphaerae bacterium RIFOXYB12_FULL_65_16]